MKKFLYWILLFSIYSCSEPEKEKIIFPGLDPKPQVRLLVFLDSSSCTECTLKNYFMWQEPVRFFNRLEDKSEFAFILSSGKETQKALEVLIHHYLPHAKLYWNREGTFERLNKKILNNEKSRTFLINKEGLILKKGSPVNDPVLWEEYVNAILAKIM